MAEATAGPRPSAAAAGIRPGLRVAAAGVSESRICGVHDHAVLLAQGLERDGAAPSLHWLWREPGALHAARRQVLAWSEALGAELERSRPDAVLLHYSAFAYSHRGLPVFVHPALAAAARARAPLLLIVHEPAYGFTRGGWRGKVWALTQRAALFDAVRTSCGSLLTTDARARWLASRRWLPSRPVAFAPVFSNLPPPRSRARRDGGTPLVGMFGYSSEGAMPGLVLDAIEALLRGGVELRLSLLGGGSSVAAREAWALSARTRGLEQCVSFSGHLPAQDLSDALARCELLLSVFKGGPTERKGTLAASLASGAPVLATDGSRAWGELAASGAIELVEPTTRALSEAIGGLLADGGRRLELGERGRAFAQQHMGVERTVRAIGDLLGQALYGN